jgi:hypothetical protein
VVDLGFLFYKDGDLSDAGLSWFGRSGEFRKAPPANVTVHLCLGLLDRVVFGRVHPCFYSDRLVQERAMRSSVLCCHQLTFGPWWCQRRRISWRPDWRTSNGGSSLCTVEGLAWCSGFRSSSMKVGRQHRWSSESCLLGWKSKVWP